MPIELVDEKPNRLVCGREYNTAHWMARQELRVDGDKGNQEGGDGAQSHDACIIGPIAQYYKYAQTDMVKLKCSNEPWHATRCFGPKKTNFYIMYAHAQQKWVSNYVRWAHSVFILLPVLCIFQRAAFAIIFNTAASRHAHPNCGCVLFET